MPPWQSVSPFLSTPATSQGDSQGGSGRYVGVKQLDSLSPWILLRCPANVLGVSAVVPRRPLPLAQVASSATGGAPIAPRLESPRTIGQVLGDSLHTFSSVRKYDRPPIPHVCSAVSVMRRFLDFARNDTRWNGKYRKIPGFFLKKILKYLLTNHYSYGKILRQ